MKRLTRAEQKALRPTQILEAAFEEFVDHGFTAARVEDIAERVGVTKGTVYVYFPTKEELFAEMIRHIASPLETFLTDLGELSGNSEERLKNFILQLYDRLLTERRLRQMLRFVISEGTRFPHVIDTHTEELIEPIIGRLQELLDEGVKQGEFVPGPRASARIVFAPIVGIAVETLIHGDRRDLELPSFIESHLDLIMGALLTRPQS
ncbi:TetR/AcrR family transcriptional regulator [Agrobacterium vaccinii]|uniref:TetR/AcrR family transcriptional regulator n=1 Tax=Agrobacterium vaccinii TaxID=2735528 RepID=UPI000DD520AB|nr:TetR/AcrR family transcriptional regulator [Agrobacterium vaccinii]UHS63497.1 TetR/AcrR family transcriptional regulator [Agrobacterium vaccinii]